MLSTSHEKVPTVVIKRQGLETGKTPIPGVWCMVSYGVGCRVVPHSCDNKAISAPSWVLAGWLARAELGNNKIQHPREIYVYDIFP